MLSLVGSIPQVEYSEIGQKNPIKWVNLHRVGDELYAKTGFWKCKDFQNDVVLKIVANHTFGIYGFSNDFPVNKTGVYIGMKNVQSGFRDNLKKLNEFLMSRGLSRVKNCSVFQHSQLDHAIFIPKEYYTNTFFVSALFSLLRAANQPFVVKELNEFGKLEETLDERYFHKVMERLTPEHKAEMDKLVFKNFQYSIKNYINAPTTCIHNAGLQTWLY